MIRRVAGWGAAWIGLVLLTWSDAGAMSLAHGPVGNPGAWFGPDAYPAEALRRGEQGRSVVMLALDAAGRITSCTVSVSSGSRSLDDATCAIATERGHFLPATDARGMPIASSQRLPVRWLLPFDQPTPASSAGASSAEPKPRRHMHHSWWDWLQDAEHLLVLGGLLGSALLRSVRRRLGWSQFGEDGQELLGDRLPIGRRRLRHERWWRAGGFIAALAATAAFLAWVGF